LKGCKKVINRCRLEIKIIRDNSEKDCGHNIQESFNWQYDDGFGTTRKKDRINVRAMFKKELLA